ncbi:MAG: toll/interleukin-1 receptor domain-containing protein [Candidatus Binatus sp.]|uniref:toll/interleukin-1 receptor domain-containing protein n=1 Tax=Candidatus Binatus sp. TaxID=2811406 RepID=UPI003C760D84
MIAAIMMSGIYQLLMLGSDDSRRDRLQSLVGERVTELGLKPNVIRFIVEKEAESRDPRAPLMAVFFGSPAHLANTALIDELLEDSIVIAPLVSSVEHVHLEVPLQLRHVNVLSPASGDCIGRLATLVLETFRLLRRERKLFISYRRVDAQPFAERLYDSLDARGFDVFIDLRSVPPAVDFQSELWHRMSDADVVVLIDTPGFRESRWTTAELAKANATNIQILHLLWPGQQEDALSSFSHFKRLGRSDFWGWVPGRGRWVRRNTLDLICDEAEQLRARAIAARNRYLIDNFCDAARDLGMDPTVQPEQWISLERSGGSTLAVVPAVGVPTSNRIHEIFDAVAGLAVKPDQIWIIYDNRGILKTWLAHLDWLDSHLPLRTVRMANAPDLLRGLTA